MWSGSLVRAKLSVRLPNGRLMEHWYPWIPRHVNTHILQPAKHLDPVAVVLHRTYGFWIGDMLTLLKGRVPSVHFLIGKTEGQWCQMVPVNVVANHAARANGWAVGIELTGRNEEPLTDWQVARVAEIAEWLHEKHGIPLAFYYEGGRVSEFAGWLSHANVHTAPKYRHSDMVTLSDWNRIYELAAPYDVAPTPPVSPPPPLTPIPSTEVPFVNTKLVTETLPQPLSDANGNGWTIIYKPLDQIVSVTVNGPYPPVDGYSSPVAGPTMQRRDETTIVTWRTERPRQPVTLIVKSVRTDV